MQNEAASMEAEIFALLKEWCDALIRLQVNMPGQPDLDGGILCPSCKHIHGRCHDALYPFLYMADRTGDARYLQAAKKLFDWGANMLCDDGSLYNDAQSTWNGITVFNAVSLHDALALHGTLLDAQTKRAWEARLLVMGEWLHQHLVIGMSTNINYFATNAAAMALLGEYFARDDFRALAKRLADYCVKHLSENMLLFGEGQPNDARSPKGCTAIDAGGYNVEESLPSLCRYAWVSHDAQALDTFKQSFRAHLDMMLPDGAWDNSLGTRAFKWTYWGSRTSDGCQEALFRLGKEDPVFAEAAWRNFECYRRCTRDGLLFGGPDYAAHGEKACAHHALCHAKVLAAVLDEGLYTFTRTALPSDSPPRLRHYPEMDTWRIASGEWRADITAYDFHYMRGGHASGGTLCLLWNKKCGPIIACGAVDYSLAEALNMQLSLKKAEHRSVCPRIEWNDGKTRWGQHYDFGATVAVTDLAGVIHAHVDAFLCNDLYERIDGDGACTLDYTLTDTEMAIHGHVSPMMKDKAAYHLPIVAQAAHVETALGTCATPQPIFNLNPGFIGREYIIRPNDDGDFKVRISVS